MQNNLFTQRVKGALVGCAYGDAMGMPTEMMSRETMEEMFPKGIQKFEPSSAKDFIGRHFAAAEVTDDTINTILVCESIIDNNGVFDAEKYILKLKRWITENSEKNPYIMGPNTAKAIHSIKIGRAHV